jgi:glycosyltransferase involved in cell wall biosynthesis
VYTTNPPFLGIVGAVVSLFRRHRYVVLLHDSYPHIAVLTGKIHRGGAVQRAWDAMNRLIYRRAAQTIVLCDRAKELICRDYAVRPELVHVIHNWADPKALRPIPKSESRFACQHGLDEKFTLLYSGNLGLYYEFDQLLALAERMRDDPDFRLVFIGAGGRRRHIVDEVTRRGIGNVVQVHPYQPFETLNDSLNACDVSLVTIAKGVEGISFPSKLYSSLAIGKVTLAISEPGSELQRIVEGNGAGVWVPLGDVDALVVAVKAIRADPARAAAMGLRSRELMEREFTMRAATVEYLNVIDRAGRAG